MTFTRRGFLSRGAATTLFARAAPARPPARLDAAVETSVVVCLRGGADVLSLLVPYRDPEYFLARPTLALAPPGRGARAVLALDQTLALHPQLSQLQDWIHSGELGIAVGVGHVDAQQSQRRPLTHRDASAALERSLGPVVPVTERALEPALLALAEQLRAGVAPRLAWVESPGWDTHVGQGSSDNGRLAKLINELSHALTAFRDASRDAFQRVRVVVVSEFGRSVGETRLGGTEDGDAGVLWVLDGPRRLGRIVGSYGSLEPSRLTRNGAIRPSRDLEQTLAAVFRGEFPA